MTTSNLTKFESWGLTKPLLWGDTSVSVHVDRNVRAAATKEDAAMQIQLEQLAVIHSIRRILMWMLIILPALVAVLAVVLSSAS